MIGPLLFLIFVKDYPVIQIIIVGDVKMTTNGTLESLITVLDWSEKWDLVIYSARFKYLTIR